MKLVILAVVCSLLGWSGFVSGQIYDEYACLYNDLTLQCPSPKTIYIHRADYGQYGNPCLDCCPPSSQDCKADVEQAFPDDMTNLRDKCDNETTCTIQILGQSLNNCPGVKQVQYANVFFRCFPEDPTTEPPTTQSTTSITSFPPRTSSTSPPSSTDPPEDGGLGAGVIVGIVFGVLILVACGILVAVIVYKKKNAPPPGKRRRKPNQRLRMQYDNNGYVHQNHIQLSVIETKENGIPVQTHTKVDPNPPVSDGKRSSKPVSAAESFRYAKEKEDVIAKYRKKTPSAADTTKTDGTSSSVINETNSLMPKAKKRSKKKSGGSKNDLSVKTEISPSNIAGDDYENLNRGEQVNAYENKNEYESIHAVSDENKRSS